MFQTFFLQASGNGLGNFMFYLPIMLLVFYFFMIRPQMNKQKKEKGFQQSIKKGNKVITTSGIHGKIVELNDEICVLETGAGKIKFERSAISMELSKKYLKPSTTKK